MAWRAQVQTIGEAIGQTVPATFRTRGQALKMVRRLVQTDRGFVSGYAWQEGSGNVAASADDVIVKFC